MSRDRVKVAVRCRPLLENEGRKECVSIHANTCTLASSSRTDVPENGFTYDFCFESSATQEDVFETLGSHVMSNAMDGYNSTLFAYGQTGSGKTHSLHGSEKDPGVLPRMAEHLFRQIEPNTTTTFVVKASYLEIYNDRLRDLLVTDNKALDIKQLADNSIIIPNLSECVVHSASDTVRLMQLGNSKRMQGSTYMNELSSRSHSIFTLDVTQSDESQQIVKRSKINIVDLAGSERQSKAQSSGERLREGCIINQSLTYLSCCINALVNGDGYVPFRNSKLTHFLSDSLAGNSKTAMLATISPASVNFDETMSTLRFATKCKKITTSPSINIAIAGTAPHSTVLQLRTEVESLKSELRVFHAGIPNSLTLDSPSDFTPMLSRANFLYFIKNKETRIGRDPRSDVLLPATCAAFACKIDIVTNGIARCTPLSRFIRNDRTVGKRENESFHLEHNDLLDFGAGASFRFSRGVICRADVVQAMSSTLRDIPEEERERACDVFEAVHHLHFAQYTDRLRELRAFLLEKAPDAEAVLVQNIFKRKPPELGVKQAQNLLTEDAFRYILKHSDGRGSTTELNPLAAAFWKGDFKTLQALQEAQRAANVALNERVAVQQDKIRTLETLRDLDIQSINRLTLEANARTEAYAGERNQWREERLRIQADSERRVSQAREQFEQELEDMREHFVREKAEWEAKMEELSQTADAYDAEYHRQRTRAIELEEILESRDESIQAYRATIKKLSATVIEMEDNSSINHVLQERNNIDERSGRSKARSKTSSNFSDEKRSRGGKRYGTPTKGTEIREFSLGAQRPETERPLPSSLAVTNQEKAERWAQRRNIAIENSRQRGNSWSRQSSRPASARASTRPDGGVSLAPETTGTDQVPEEVQSRTIKSFDESSSISHFRSD